MSVKKRKDGSLVITTSDGVSAIAKVIGTSEPENSEKFEAWVEKCAKDIKLCTHTLRETEEYFLKNCEALPLEPNDRRVKFFQYNLVMSFFKDKLKYQLSEIPFDGSEEEIEKWYKQHNDMRDEIMNASPEHFGLTIRSYYLPQNERNQVYYEQAMEDFERYNKQHSVKASNIKKQDICFFFEESTEFIQASGCSAQLINDLTVYKGVKEADIKDRNASFLGYISALRDMGKLCDFRD